MESFLMVRHLTPVMELRRHCRRIRSTTLFSRAIPRQPIVRTLVTLVHPIQTSPEPQIATSMQTGVRRHRTRILLA